MAVIITRQTGPDAKGSPLTNTELDTNFINLKAEAESAIANAGTAQAAADAAQADATQALANAATAQVAADAAQADATIGIADAATAQAAADAAQADATQALANAATAQAAADAAQLDATQALFDAATGIGNAATAQAAADAAQARADAAHALATTAVANALTAQNAADAAQGDATTALANAATAQAAANAAQADATTALANAATAQAAADAAQLDATQALSDAAAAQATADSALGLATHSNRANLDSINQNLATTDTATFAGLNITQIDFAITPNGTIATAPGRAWYNQDDDTLNIGHADGTTQQVGQEFFLPPVINNTGVEIPNGTYVMVTGVLGDKFEVAPAVTDGSVDAHYMVGITTSTFPIGGDTGKVTTEGMVRDFNTSGWPVGTILYPNPAVPGGFTDTKPTAPSLRVAIAMVMKQAVQGWIYVRNVIGHKHGEHDSDVDFGILADNEIAQYDLAAQAWKNKSLYDAGISPLVPGSPTGFLYPDLISSEYDSTTRTVTLTGDLTAFFHGKPTGLVSPWTSPPHPNELNKSFFLYTSDGITWGWTEFPWKFEDWQAAFIYYGSTDKFGLNEFHGLMQWQVHDELHHMIGTYKVSGGTIAGYVAGSTVVVERRPDVVETVIKDEDIRTTLPTLLNPGENYKTVNLTGAGTITFANNQLEIVPVLGSRPYYNQFTGGNWVQTLMPQGSYMTIWLIAIPVTVDTQSQGYRYIWLQGQTATNLAGQQSLQPPDISWGNFTNLATEFVVLGKVILNYGGGDWNINSFEILSGGRASSVGAPAGNYLSSVFSDGTLTGTGESTNLLSVDLEGTYAQELTAIPRKVHFVYGGSTDGGATPDATTQASIDALTALSIPLTNIRWIYTA